MSTPSNIANIAWAWQSGHGTAASTSANRVYMHGGDQPHSNSVKEDFEETTSNRMLQDAYISSVDGEGAPEHYVMADMIASLLYGALGGQSTSGGSDPYSHVLVPASTLPYATVWRSLANGLFEKFKDMKIGHLKIHGESGKPLLVTPSWMGGTPSSLSAEETTAAIEKALRFLHYDGSGALKVEGTAVASIRAFDIDIENTAQVIPGDSVTPTDVSEGRLVVTAGVTVLVDDFALYNRIHYGSATPTTGTAPSTAPLELAGSPAGLSFVFTRQAASPGPTRSLTIAIPRIQVDPFDDQPSPAGDPMTRQISYRAYQPAAGASITGTVLNGRATDY